MQTCFLKKTLEYVLTLSKVHSEYQEKKRNKKETISNTISNSFDNFILADVKSTKVFGSCLGHLLKDQRFVPSIRNIDKSYVRFQLSWKVCTEHFCNFAEVF